MPACAGFTGVVRVSIHSLLYKHEQNPLTL